MDRLCCNSHALDELVLLGSVFPYILLLGNDTCRVDISLAVCRSDTYRLVLEDTSETAHRMPLEVRKVNHPVIVEHILAHKIVLYVCGVLDRNLHLAVTVEKVNRSNGGKAVILEYLHVGLGLVTRSFICRIALHYCTVHLFHKVLYERRLQEIMSTGLTRRNLHRYLAAWSNT